MPEELTINFDVIAELGYRAVRRAYVFMGLGTNAARSDALNEYKLGGLMQVQLLAREPTPDELVAFKREFERWVVGNGLRELIDGLSIYFDEVFKVIEVMTKGGIDKKEFNSFHGKGLSGKLVDIRERLECEANFSGDLHSWVLARNCLSHRLGVVAPRDCNDDGCLTVRWKTFEIFVREPDGNEIIIGREVTEPIYLEGGGSICARYTERQKQFSVRQALDLEPGELLEICQNAQDIVSEFKKIVLKRLEELGCRVITHGAPSEGADARPSTKETGVS